MAPMPRCEVSKRATSVPSLSVMVPEAGQPLPEASTALKARVDWTLEIREPLSGKKVRVGRHGLQIRDGDVDEGGTVGGTDCKSAPAPEVPDGGTL